MYNIWICWFSFRWHLLAGWTWLANLRQHIENGRTNFEGFFFSQLLCASLQTPTNVCFPSIWQGCYCSRKLSSMEVQFSKWFYSVKKVLGTFSYRYLWPTILQCDLMQKMAKNTQILKIANCAYIILAPELRNHPKYPKKLCTESWFAQNFE